MLASRMIHAHNLRVVIKYAPERVNLVYFDLTLRRLNTVESV